MFDASCMAFLIGMMLEIWLPMWKCSSCRQSSMSRAPRRSHDLDDLADGEAELGAVAGRVLPAADAARAELGAHAERGPDAGLLGGLEHEVELLEALEHDDHGLAEALREQRGLDVLAVLVAVADDQAVRVADGRQRDQELGLGAGFEPEAARAAPNSTISSTRCLCWFTLTGNTPR